MTKTRITNLILLAISTIGAFLVSEQVISQESLVEMQGVVGLALGGGGFTLFTVLNLIKLIPQEVATSIIEKVGMEKVESGFEKLDNALNEINDLKVLVKSLYDEMILDREIRQDLGVYDEVSQDLKDRL